MRSFVQTNLVSDQPGVATDQDPNLVNAWGISDSPATGRTVLGLRQRNGPCDLYKVDPATNTTTKLGLEVTIPGRREPTGQVFNSDKTAFNGDVFLFVSEDGTISGWQGSLGTTAETLQPASDAVYKGVALATTQGHTYLYAANFRKGTIDVLKGDSGAPDLTGKFKDPKIHDGYAPFNIQLLNGKLYVTYA